MVAVHERLHEHAPRALREVERLLDLVRPARVRLLAEHVLPGLERLHRPLVVHAVRKGDVDRVDPAVREQLLVRPVGSLEPALVRVRLRFRRVTAADGDDFDAIGRLRGGEDRVVGARGREQPEPH